MHDEGGVKAAPVEELELAQAAVDERPLALLALPLEVQCFDAMKLKENQTQAVTLGNIGTDFDGSALSFMDWGSSEL